MPLSPIPNFPTSLDSLPDPTTTTYTDDDGFELDLLLQKHNAILELLEATLGAGITTTNGVMRKIAQASGTGASGVLEFSSIPATYRALRLVVVGRSDAAVTSTAVRMTFETSPTAGAYNTQQGSFANTTLTGIELIGTQDLIHCGAFPGASSTTNLYGSTDLLLPEYANTSFFKNAAGITCAFANIASGGLVINTIAGVWESTAAIDRIRLTLASGNWTTASRATLYGIPG